MSNSIRVEEAFEAHTKSIDASGNIKSASISYLVFGVNSEDEALRAVLNIAPKEMGNAVLDSIAVDERADATSYKISASYNVDSSRMTSLDNDEDESTLSFDCGGGTTRVTHAISTTILKGPDPGNAVNWNGEPGTAMSVAGVDVPTAQLRETYTKQMSLSSITTTFKRRAAWLVGKINSTKFKGWNPGEVQFLGMSYSAPAKGAQKVSVVFNFAIQVNEPRRQIDGITFDKKGFDYVWLIPHPLRDKDKKPTLRIKGAYVSRVCEYGDFSLLGL